jgi:ABC-type transport system involved in cytochrome c biogenesis permease subunit
MTTPLYLPYLFWSSFTLLTLAYLAVFFFPRGFRYLLALGALSQLTLLICRGWLIGFFPLTNKFESFYAFSLSVFLVLLYRTSRGTLQRAPTKAYHSILMFLGWGFLLASCFFPQKISFAPPLMLTVWYVFHVPLSFFAYALWGSSAAAGVVDWGRGTLRVPNQGGTCNVPLLAKIRDDDALYGFILWSVSMIFGGIWGYVAWGSYFLWDPKVVWSVVLWFFYASYIHLDAWPEMESKKNLLAIIGLAAVLITYVGTSFFAKSSHSF